MKMTVLLAGLCAVLVVFLAAPVVAQQSATTSPPVIRSDENSVVFTIRVQNFTPGKQYRIGLGVAGDTPAEGTYTLSKNGQALDKQAVTFTQGNTSHWWGVSKLTAKGYQLAAADLSEGIELTFEVALPFSFVGDLEKLYLFVSRDYGSDTWYLEDGSELDNSYW